ncbi:MAG: flagellar export protein FliJ [Aureliella sp.]
MSNFRFRLQSIMRLRVRERDKAGQALQQAQLAKQKLLDQMGEIQEESDRQIAVRSAASLGPVDIQRVIDAQRYQLTLAENIHSIQENVKLIEQEIDKRRAKLVVCEQEVKVLEKLEEKQRSAWLAEEESRAQARLDEWGSFQHFRRSEARG